MRWITGAVAEGSRRLFAYLSDHSATYFSDRHAGALVNKISNAASGIERLIGQWLWQFFPLIIGLMADLYLTYLTHIYFALTLLVWICIYVPINVFFVSRLHKLSFAYAESSSVLKGKMVDSTSNVDTVQYTGSVDHERRHIGKHIGDQRGTHLPHREWWWSEWVLVTNGVLLALFMLSMFAFGMWLIERSEISVGSLVMIVTIVIGLEQRMFFLGQNLTQAVSFYGQVSEGLKELLEPHEIVDRPDAKPLIVRDAAIEFKGSDFSYRGKRVFRGNFDLQIAGGEKVGLVGHSGAGKSTLVSLLLRRFELDGGVISIDGQNITDMTLDSLRKAVAFVPQSTSSVSPFDHRKYPLWTARRKRRRSCDRGRACPSRQFYPRASRRLQYKSRRTRRDAFGRPAPADLGRASCIAKRADPAARRGDSALDSVSEAAIQEALVGLMSDKTVIAIAHRLSTLRAMDRLVIVENGEIVEDGSHEDLIALGGVYASLWNSQVSGFIPD